MKKTQMQNKALEYLRTLSDLQLNQLVNEIKLSEIPEDALVRKVIKDIYNYEKGFFVLYVVEMLYPLLEVTMERMISYSPHVKL